MYIVRSPFPSLFQCFTCNTINHHSYSNCLLHLLGSGTISLNISPNLIFPFVSISSYVFGNIYIIFFWKSLHLTSEVLHPSTHNGSHSLHLHLEMMGPSFGRLTAFRRTSHIQKVIEKFVYNICFITKERANTFSSILYISNEGGVNKIQLIGGTDTQQWKGATSARKSDRARIVKITHKSHWKIARIAILRGKKENNQRESLKGRVYRRKGRRL